MANQPQRRDYNDVVRDLTQRVDKLEKAARSNTVFLPNVTSPPSNPGGGGLYYVSGGSLHFIGSSGTNTTVAPA